MDIAISKRDIPIRLTRERWFHITEGHPEIAGYYYEILEAIEDPEAIYKGNDDELIAIKEFENGKYIAAVYRELDKNDGFLITAFLTRRIKQLERREKIWEIPK